MALFDFFKKKKHSRQEKSSSHTNTETKNQASNILTIEDAVQILRNRIIEQISHSPSDTYELASLLHGWDAANCFPNDAGIKWSGAWFYLNLKTRKLSAYVSTYPNQFGACREASYSLTASEFNSMAKKYNMRKELQFFETDEDWAKLFDENFKAAISDGLSNEQKQEEERKNKERLENAIVIPEDFSNRSPNMDLNEVFLKLHQLYSSSSVKMEQKNGHYHIEYIWDSHTSYKCNKYQRELTSSEAVWVEEKIENAINNPDNSTWHSLVGDDEMDIVIKKTQGKGVELHDVEPIEKYYYLNHELEKLAQYGSKR